MRIASLLGMVLALIAPWAAISAQSTAVASSPAQVRLLQARQDGATLEFVSPQYQLVSTTVPAGTFDTLTLPGGSMSDEPGKPQLPVVSAVLGVPAGASINLRVLQDQVTLVQGRLTIQPVAEAVPLTADLQPGTSVVRPDPQAYASPAPYPSVVARVAEDAWLRNQRIVRIEIFPFQYNPARRQVTWHTQLQIDVQWQGGQSAQRQGARTQTAALADPFDAVLQQTLLNYSVAGAWRVAPQPSADPTQTGRQQAAPAPRYKIVVDRDGMYRLTYADLRAAGLDVDTVDPRTFRLTSQGQNIAIDVSGEADGRFDPADTLTFFGQKYAAQSVKDTVILDGQLVTADTTLSQQYSLPTTYTDENVYWLEVGGTPGLRMATTDGTAAATADAPSAFRTTVRAEQSNLWWTWHFTSRDTWLWDRVQTSSDTTRSYAFNLPAPADGSLTATIRGELVARTSSDHRTRIRINDADTPVEDAVWQGQTRYRFEGQIPQSVLREGVNQLFWDVSPSLSTGWDDLYLDWFEIEYARRFVAEQDQLTFTTAADDAEQYAVDGFTTPNAAVYDITAPLTPRVVQNAQSTQQDNAYRTTFAATPAAGQRYLVVATPALQTPKRITRYTPTNLRARTNGADYIIITHRDFYAAAQRLANYRAAQGLRTAVVDIDDLYNEFNDGIYHPIAIKRFLAYAYANWQAPAPRSVVLVGDGHWNMKGFNVDRYGAPPIYMPPNLAWVDPWQGEVDSTNLLAAIVGDDIVPDVAIGRLPVNSVDELNAVINKIISYETAPTGAWQQRLLFVADNTPDQAGDFVALSETTIGSVIPPSFQVDRLYLNDLCGEPTSPATACPTATNQLLGRLNTTGALFVNYIGHASIGRWAHEQLLVNSNIGALNNSRQLPIILSMTCLDGYWFYPNQAGLTEDLLRADQRGAIATFSPTGLGVAQGHDVLNRGFYDSIFQGGVRTLGPATLSAKLALYATGEHSDLINTFTIFGDPALRLPLPAPVQSTPTPEPVPTPQPGLPPVTPRSTLHLPWVRQGT